MTRILQAGLCPALALALAAAPAAAETLTEDEIRAAVGAVDGEAIIANAETTENWPTHGLDYAESRFSKLAQIHTGNVEELGLAWSYGLESKRGVEATPVVVDGVMYVTASWSVVHALDAKTGEKLWVFDPEVPKDYAAKGCCDVVNRGVALHDGKVYVASFDGYLYALDAATGEVVWKADTVTDRSEPYTITGAPRVYNGKVIIGNGGAEYGVRGYLTAYDAQSGEQVWRWFSVPGDPSEPFEDESMARAAQTWDPAGEWWKAGGGGTMWDSMAFDPELNLMYVGTGNGSPWNREHRSPGGGDNLYLSSIVALDPDTGEYVCHYQEVPGDNWDYTATQHIILGDLTIEGRERKVMMHAPKAGFFYVVDRTDCEFISAEPFVKTTWAEGYDANGRPIENPASRSKDEPWEQVPSAYGAHNWHPMSYSPQTGLVYIPAQGVPLVVEHDPEWALDEHIPARHSSQLGWNLGFLLSSVPPEERPFGQLLAWDPVKQEAAWSHDHASPWNGGTLATAGNLVFQGTADGRFVAYDATTGAAVWQVPVTSGVVAAPSTFEIDGEQHVAIAVGWGGVYGVTNRATDRVGPGRVFVFKLGGEAEMPETKISQRDEIVAGVDYNPDHVQEGRALYLSNCLMCHGIPAVANGGHVPNPGYSSPEMIADLSSYVLSDVGAARGMPNFSGKLTEAQVEKMAAFIQATADAVRGQ
ncbi:MAG: PQQ-dependent dehydrogenase, methanol/ethanol family [Pseudomonadota bacterium]